MSHGPSLVCPFEPACAQPASPRSVCVALAPPDAVAWVHRQPPFERGPEMGRWGSRPTKSAAFGGEPVAAEGSTRAQTQSRGAQSRSAGHLRSRANAEEPARLRQSLRANGGRGQPEWAREGRTADRLERGTVGRQLQRRRDRAQSQQPMHESPAAPLTPQW